MTPNFNIGKGDGPAYVANMTSHAHIDINGETTINIADSSADLAELLASTAVVASTNYDVDVEIPEAFGRSVSVTSDAAGDITIIGKDFLGQTMSETITCTVGTEAGAKAFKRITELRAASDLTGNVVLKAGAEYGLPFCAVEVVREVVDGAASTEGAITAPDTTTPSATTGDVRGTFNPNTAGDGAKDIALTYVTTSQLAGGLYGQAQA